MKGKDNPKLNSSVRWSITKNGPSMDGRVDALYVNGLRGSKPFVMVHTGWHIEWTANHGKIIEAKTRYAVELSNQTLEVLDDK